MKKSLIVLALLAAACSKDDGSATNNVRNGSTQDMATSDARIDQGGGADGGLIPYARCGIANVTLLQPDGSSRGFDTGPSNTLMDDQVLLKSGPFMPHL